ncbi:response regulator transcription factor [Timonella senegalensis]|uniref:response regulator transcription factor n=1 Tax=Timonella senegalensis TaxID=1465825 RepID=UPI0002D8B926|nr:response regulator transcription factor [Timonella senegalensis]
MNKILIVEDEERISSFISKGLRAAGYEPLAVPSAQGARIALAAGTFSLIVLDIGLPDESGLDVLASLRESGNDIPVIVLTARTSIDDTVASLEGGADDYMAKPFRFEELLARIKLRLRNSSPQEEASNELVNGPLRLELLTRRVYLGDRLVDLSTREFALAETFLTNVDIVLSREQLLSLVWGYDFDPGSNVVDVYVRYLRNKIGASWFETVRGVGYRMPKASKALA